MRNGEIRKRRIRTIALCGTLAQVLTATVAASQKRTCKRKKRQQLLKRYMASGSHCPIGLHLVNGRRDGAAAPVGADDLWYHTGQS